MKYFLFIILIFCFTYLGFFVANFYIKKRKFFQSLFSFLNVLSGEIGFLQTDIVKIIEIYKENFCENFQNFLDYYLKLIFENEETSYENLQKYSNLNFLKIEQKNHIFQFFSLLGKTEVFEQQNLINKYMSIFSNFLSNSEKDEGKYANNSKKLGFILGIFVCIVLF